MERERRQKNEEREREAHEETPPRGERCALERGKKRVGTVGWDGMVESTKRKPGRRNRPRMKSNLPRCQLLLAEGAGTQ
jgi:hypothetical protein